MINDKICAIFDDIHRDNLNKINYITHYKFIYDITSNDNEYEIELIKNSLIINYQNLCINYCEKLNQVHIDTFLVEYYNLFNKTQKNNSSLKKIFSYFLNSYKRFNIDNIFKNYWSNYVVKPNLKKIKTIYLEVLNVNNIDELKKITLNFKDNVQQCYYFVINELYVNYVNDKIQNISNTDNITEIIKFITDISKLNYLYSKNTISKIENNIDTQIIACNIEKIFDSLREHYSFLIYYLEEIALSKFENVFPKFEAEIDIINSYHRIIHKFDYKNFLSTFVCLFESTFTEKIKEILKNEDVKLISTYIDFLEELYNNLNLECDFLKDFDKNALYELFTKNLSKLKFKKDFTKTLVKFINENISDNPDYVNQLGIIVNSLQETEKEVFGELYKKAMIQRLINSEKINIVNEQLYIDKLIFKYQIDCASRVPVILNDYKKSLESTNEFNYINNSNSKVITATYDIWELKENNCLEFVNPEYEKEINNFKSNFREYYKCRYESKDLKWCDYLSNCIIIFNGNELKCSLKQADILSLFNENDSININDYKLDELVLNSLVRSKILNLQGTNLSINERVRTKKCLNLMKFLKSSKKSSISNNQIINKLLWEKKTYIEAYIIRKLKKEKTQNKNTLYDCVIKKYEKFGVTTDFFEKIINKLEEQDYVKIHDKEISYIP